MNYSNEERMVRVDFFKPSGKWYTTEAVEWVGEGKYIIDEFKNSLVEHFKDNPLRLSNMHAVCLEPYHQYSFPLMLMNGSWGNTVDFI